MLLKHQNKLVLRSQEKLYLYLTQGMGISLFFISTLAQKTIFLPSVFTFFIAISLIQNANRLGKNTLDLQNFIVFPINKKMLITKYLYLDFLEYKSVLYLIQMILIYINYDFYYLFYFILTLILYSVYKSLYYYVVRRNILAYAILIRLSMLFIFIIDLVLFPKQKLTIWCLNYVDILTVFINTHKLSFAIGIIGCIIALFFTINKLIFSSVKINIFPNSTLLNRYGKFLS